VFVHDAISYMTTASDLRRAGKTVFLHCRQGGAALLQPDHVRETFRPSRECGGHTVGERSLRYIELTHAMKPGRDSTTVDYTFTLKGRNGTPRSIADRHHIGVFARATWLNILRLPGFRAHTVVDPWKRVCFLTHRAHACDTPTHNGKQSRSREGMKRSRDRKKV
jgi:hypothetical protein